MKQQESTGNGYIDLGTEIFSVGRAYNKETLREDRLRQTAAFIALAGLIATVLGDRRGLGGSESGRCF
jgi:hypothetical protein